MLNRTKGRILLALLVITGMAGTPKNTTISGEERKFCVAQLKKSKNELTELLKGLSPKQLDFKLLSHQQSIRDHIFHIAATEKEFEYQLQSAMKQRAVSANKMYADFTDAQLIALTNGPEHRLFPISSGERFSWSSPAQALESFRTSRNRQVKYIRNTTENLRSHVIQLEFGYVDCYQLLLVVNNHCNHHLQQIRNIIESRSFPKS